MTLYHPRSAPIRSEGTTKSIALFVHVASLLSWYDSFVGIESLPDCKMAIDVAVTRGKHQQMDEEAESR